MKEKPSPMTEPTSISSLSYVLLLNILARVSRLYHPSLSLVSKTFRSIVDSPELYETRSLINRTESCVYMCLRVPFDPNVHWYALRKKVIRSVPRTSTGNLFVGIPSPYKFYGNSFSRPSTSIVAVGSDIYQIGGDVSDNDSSSSRVYVLDCRSHTWRQAPSMQVERNFSTASLVDGKIYVTGGYKDRNNLNWVKVFDPKTQTWDSVINPRIERREEHVYADEDGNIYGRRPGRVFKSIGLEGKFYLFGDDQDVVYNPKEDIWNPIGVDYRGMGNAVNSRCVTTSYCVIDDILFFYDDEGVFKLYDSKVSLWKKLNGLERLPNLAPRGLAKMVDLDGKMAVFWFEHRYFSDDDSCAFEIWCAEIALERRNGDEIWGRVKWIDEVATVDESCNLSSVDFLSATI